jgi:hypothetical protein
MQVALCEDAGPRASWAARVGSGGEHKADAARASPRRPQYRMAARTKGWRTGVVRQQLMRVWETGVHEQSAGPQTRKYSPRPGVCPMESSQPPGEGSPRPRPDKPLFAATARAGFSSAKQPACPARQGERTLFDGFAAIPWNLRVYAGVTLRATQLVREDSE